MLHALALCCTSFASPIQERPRAAVDDAQQIYWQRSLDDALALAKAQQRALFVAINADGESASERIVRERYRDPAFVASTRPFVCVVGSVFRHTPRDHDDQGRRIACPRLGEVTCGEHIAMEPLVHERYLAGTKIELFNETVDRISPRHALVQPDGTKSFDMFLLFDLRELDEALSEAAARAKPFDRNEAFEYPSARRRLAFEAGLTAAQWHGSDGSAWVTDALAAWSVLAAHSRAQGDAGWNDGLRCVLARADELGVVVNEVVELAKTYGTVDATLAALRDALQSQTPTPAVLIEPLASLGRDQQGARTLVLSYLALGSSTGGADSERGHAFAALHTTLGDDEAHAVVLAVDSAGGSFDPTKLLALAPPAVKRASPPPEPDSGELERVLGDADAARNSDPRGEENFGRAALAVAKRRLRDNQTKDLLDLLADAELALAKAAALRPDDPTLWLARAHVANYQSRFDQQEEFATRALELLHFQPRSDPAKIDDVTVEALRWLGDACARQLGSRASGDPAEEARGILLGGRSLVLAAASAETDPVDWLSVASFFGALGRSRERAAFAEAGVRRFPSDNALRAELSDALWSLGRPDSLVAKSETIAHDHADSAASAWYAGYALVLYAESLRRGEDPDGAIAAYERAAPHFRRAIELEPSFRDSSEHYLALAAMGRGFAHLLAGRQVEASRCVVDAASIRPAIVAVRDGLDREGVDLIDGALEFRARGASPVDALAWLGDLRRVDANNPFWARAISDAALREGIRSDGRGDAERGDRDLATAIEAARVALEIEATPEDARALAQAATVQAERWLKRGEPTPAIEQLLGDAAAALGRERPAAGAGIEALTEFAAGLRAELGAARPVARPGR